MPEWPTLAELATSVRAGERTATEVVGEALAAIEAGNAALGAFVAVDPELALEAARAVDQRVARGEDPGPLAGVPFGVKDLEDCAGLPTSHGSLLHRDAGPVPADSVHVGRLRAAGAVPVGKTAAPEFGTLNFTKTKAFGVARNPWDTACTPGGSSGGSAAAVSAGLVPMSTASDGGGSTRIPAGFCGLVGHKASFGRIPQPGPDGSLTAVVGALTTTVADAARHLDVTAGPDDRDRRSLPPPGASYERAAETLEVAGLRARWSTDLGFAAVDPEVAEIARAAAEVLVTTAGLSADDEPVRLTDPVRTWLSNGALDLWFEVGDDQWPGCAPDLTLYSRRVLEQTESLPAPKLARAQQRRARLDADAAALFAEVDVLLTPTTAVPAFAAEGPPTAQIAGRRVDGAMATPFTMLANMCWNPSISVPAGLTAGGLPVGLMITARRHRDDVCLRLARIFEQARPWLRWAP
ncbi:MAG: amidase [Actinobacteria bacterium]|nr:amidase [Actinomycetota bacterium]